MTDQTGVPPTLGKRIADARRRKGVVEGRDLLVPEVAEAVGVTSATVYHWEADSKVPREEALAEVARYLGVTPAYLRYGVQSGTEPDPALDRKVTPGEIEAARSLAARIAAKQKPKTNHHNHG